MTDTSVVNPNEPFRMAPQQDVDAWRQGTPVPPPPSGPPGMKDELAQQQKSAAALDASEGKYQSAMGPLQAGMKHGYQDLSKATANTPPQQPLPPRPDAKEYEKNSMAFASAMAVLGAVTSHFGRANGTQALSAFAGALNGWKTGNLENYEQATKKWEEDTKATIETNRQLMQKYQAILDSKKLNIDQMSAQIALVAAENHHDIMYQAAKSQNFTLQAQIKDKMWEYTEGPKGLDLAFQKMRAPLEAQRIKSQTDAAKWQSFEGQQELNSVKPDGTPKYDDTFKKNVQRTIDIYGGAEGKGTLNARGSAIAQDRQQFINEYMDAHGGEKPNSAQVTQWEGERAGNTAEGRVVGQRAGNIAIAVQEASKTIPNVEKAAEISAGKGTAFWNSLENKWKIQKGDENFAFYVQQMNSLINLYGRVISGGGKGTVSDLEHGRDMLNPNMPLSAVKGSLRGFKTEIGIAEEAPGEVRARMRGERPADKSAAPAADEAGSAGGWGKAEVVQ